MKPRARSTSPRVRKLRMRTPIPRPKREQAGCKDGAVDDPETLDVVGAFFVPSGKTLRRRASIFFSKRAAWACRSFAESLKEARSRSVWLSRISIARETMEPV